jgi:C1A family cysteine protease
MKRKHPPRRIKRYGWIPDLPDARDHLYSAPLPALGTLPPKVDLRPRCPPVLDQGQLGSCTAHALANAHRFEQMKQKSKTQFMPSRLFIYYNERVMEGTVDQDTGGMLRDGMKSIAQQGVCVEADWPYDLPRFADAPSAACYRSALDHQVLSYQRLSQTLSQMKGCLASGYPFVHGFTVYQSFETSEVAQSGIAPLPGLGESVLGGHAVMVVGYDDSQQRFITMNSWGTKWGMKGFFTIPYAYLTDPGLAADFWTVRIVEG